MKRFLESGEAVTEVMDFITIVGILILSFSLIGLAGYPILESAQKTRYTENTRQSFVVLADNINKVALGQAPSQSAELKMYGGTLGVVRVSTIQINGTVFNETSYSNESLTVDLPMYSIENSIGDNVVAYEGTGVWVKYPTGTVLNAYKPLITNMSDVLIIPVVYITGKSAISGSGMSRVTVCQQELPTEEGGCGMPSVTIFRNVSNITVTITGDYSEGWRDYFINTMKWSYDPGETYTAKLNTAKNLDLYIVQSRIYTVIT
ncbi:hypothetical protein ANME2D_01823 [Candidatus Methanoperedens nitroreducens]|uniref:Archaeal flagellin-like protein n=1 Tax=Candidatus Methanoperedens nitratireducens TaxID=1392998 RepID=A0A062V577_9EURY|nr:hypothetical protein [Candidatus Methanoperedens nitroreducens]KCZ71768.1 hypothetical protein ANME2D_01823 [Candidatus Methanoperedens nitroreducens]MDJ1422259.1 hypothetical protein [Candidatus Methanoperedens sp.]